ncbi:MAG: Gfo/Idh/MocA family oxidoreductase [Candidatus Glassbacteria bacterium]|nr:Gfo/Idh/MocA family oxidoreductase [Candidatus Glassbacteria bacterium]
MMDQLRVGVVGAGYISTTYHCPSLVKLKSSFESLELAAVCDTDEKRAADAAGEFGFAAHYTDYGAMLAAESLDAALVLVPPAVMQEVAAEFIRRKLPVLLEKPPAGSGQGVRELIAERRKAGKPAVVALNRRFMPLARQAREIVDRMAARDRPANACTARMLRHKRTEQEFALGTGVHSIDLLRYLLGDVASVSTNKWQADGNEAPSYLVDFEFRNGARANLAILPESGLEAERYTVHGPGWCLMLDAPLEWTIDYPGRLSLYEGRERHSVQDNAVWPPVFRDNLRITGFLGENEHFLNCVLGKEIPSPALEDCLQSIEIGECVQSGGKAEFN